MTFFHRRLNAQTARSVHKIMKVYSIRISKIKVYEFANSMDYFKFIQTNANSYKFYYIDLL